MLAKENIMALRRAKRRNGERIALAFGGKCVNSVDDITEEDLVILLFKKSNFLNKGICWISLWIIIGRW